MNKYDKALIIRRATIQVNGENKVLDDFWKEQFDILQEAVDKAKKYDEKNESKKD